jgi:metallo-beta-lactamase family protein
MRLTCHGAAGTVTGSCHLLETKHYKILVDCGSFQGRGQGGRNDDEFPFDPAEIDFLLLTHAHLDHVGRVPLLVKRGFEGQIVSTLATYDFARLILMDSAKIQEEDARRKNRRRSRRNAPPAEPLYTVEDVLESLDFFESFAAYNEPIELADGLIATFSDAGHVLGSAFIELEVREGRGRARRITFSGDLGNMDKPLVRDPEAPDAADVVIMESTYGDRSHRPFDETVDELREVLKSALARGGNVIIPSFALERSQELLYVLHSFYRAGDLPRCDIYLDSPMAINCTRIFTKHGDCFDEEALQLHREGGNPFQFPPLQYIRDARDSREINAQRGGAIIIAGSGMCTGGRVTHHLRHNLWRPECSVIFIGYAAVGTIARTIIDGEPSVEIFGEDVAINADIHTLNGFSGHAGQDTLLQWLEETGEPEQVFLVHGEDRQREALSAKIGAELGMPVRLPMQGEVFEL